MARSVGAVVAGFVVTMVVAFSADEAVLRFVPDVRDAAGRVTDPRLLILMLAYSALAAVAGGYVTARLAPSRPLAHALVLGGIALALTVVATVLFWASGPAWYHVAAMGMVLPCAWLGGTLVERGRARRRA